MSAISEEQLEGLHRALQRISALPISRMTLLEVQNAIRDTFQGKPDIANAVYESLMTGDMNDLLTNADGTDFQALIDRYTPTLRIAKEVAEGGEFLNSFSCDFVPQGNRVFFMNRMRRIDAQEYYYMTSPETSIRLSHMFINRLKDLKQRAGTLDLPQALKDELASIKKDIDTILS